MGLPAAPWALNAADLRLVVHVLQQLPTSLSRLPGICGPGMILWNMVRERVSDAAGLYGLLLQPLTAAVTERPVILTLRELIMRRELSVRAGVGCLTGFSRSQACTYCLTPGLPAVTALLNL